MSIPSTRYFLLLSHISLPFFHLLPFHPSPVLFTLVSFVPTLLASILYVTADVVTEERTACCRITYYLRKTTNEALSRGWPTSSPRGKYLWP